MADQERQLTRRDFLTSAAAMAAATALAGCGGGGPRSESNTPIPTFTVIPSPTENYPATIELMAQALAGQEQNCAAFQVERDDLASLVASQEADRQILQARADILTGIESALNDQGYQIDWNSSQITDMATNQVYTFNRIWVYEVPCEPDSLIISFTGGPDYCTPVPTLTPTPTIIYVRPSDTPRPPRRPTQPPQIDPTPTDIPGQ